MKNKKRMLAIGLMIAILGTAVGNPFSNISEAAMPQEEHVYFEETFDTDGVLDNWTSNIDCTACVTGETFKKPYDDANQYYMYVSNGSITSNDYTITCDVTFASVENVELASTIAAGIAARVDSTSQTKTGYEFQVSVSGDTVKAILRDRGNTMSTQQQVVTLDAIYDTPHKLKMEVYGSSIKCYLGDNAEPVIDYIDTTYTTGTAGIRAVTKSAGVDVIYDNFKVYDTTVRDHKFCDDFSGYNLETNEAIKTALETNGWYVRNDDVAAMAKNGAYVIPNDNATQHVYLRTDKARGALGWNDYSVEADVTIGTDSTDVLTSSMVIASVTGRHTTSDANNGYEVQLRLDKDDEGVETTTLRIVRRGETNTELGKTEFTIVKGQRYNLKAVFQGNEIHAYVENVLLLSVKDADNTYPIGYAGIRRSMAASSVGSGVDVTFDNFVVYDYDEPPVAFSDDFNSYLDGSVEANVAANKSAMNAKGWQPGDARATYFTGTAYAIPYNINTNLVLSSLNEASAWNDYSVEARLTLQSNETADGATVAGIAGRVQNNTNAKSGYDFIIYKAKTTDSTAQLRLRLDGTVIDSDETVKITCPADGVEFRLKMEFDGTVIKCYFNGGDAVITHDTVNDTTKYSTGYAGIRKSNATGLTVSFDDFKVCPKYVKEIVGDIDGNATVNDEDTCALRSNLIVDEPASACDVDKNTVIDICDLVRIKRLVYSLQD